MDIEKIAKAIEADAGMALPEIRQALTEARSGLAHAETGEGRVTTAEQIWVRSARGKTGLSQQAFADRINTPVATLRDWEQGRFSPPGGVLCLMRLIHSHPELMRELEAA